MSRIMLDEAIAGVLNDLARFPSDAPSGAVVRRCSRCNAPGHYAKTCTATTTATLSPRADLPASLVGTRSETAHVEAVIELQEEALAQHRSAERHWLAAGDADRAGAATWRQDYVRSLLEQLRSDLAALRA